MTVLYNKSRPKKGKNHREKGWTVPGMALAECESAPRQYAHREYFLASDESRQGSRQRTNFQARWMAQSGEWGLCTPIGDANQWIPWRHRKRCCADNPLHIVYRHRVQTSSCHTHRLTLRQPPAIDFAIQHDTAIPFPPFELPDHPARPTVTHL